MSDQSGEAVEVGARRWANDYGHLVSRHGEPDGPGGTLPAVLRPRQRPVADPCNRDAKLLDRDPALATGHHIEIVADPAEPRNA
jgi:hypothetical protein